MRVLCIQSRQVANDIYVEGEEYEVEEARARKYHQYFRPAASVPESAPAAQVADKSYSCSECGRTHKADSGIGARHRGFAVSA